MLVIRQAQLDALEQEIQRPFVVRVARHLRALFRKRLSSVSDAELFPRIHEAIARARGYRILTEHDLSRFAEYTIYLGHDFDTRLPWAAAILGDLAVPGTIKMDRIDDAIADQQRSSREG